MTQTESAARRIFQAEDRHNQNNNMPRTSASGAGVGAGAGAAEVESVHISMRPKTLLEVLTRSVLNEIEDGAVEYGSVGVVVSALRAVVFEGRSRVSHGRRAWTAAEVERLCCRIVTSIIPNPTHPVRKQLKNIVWALKRAAALDKEHFGGAVFQWAAGAPVDAVLAAMQKVQQQSAAAVGKVTAAAMDTAFMKTLTEDHPDLTAAAMEEAKALVEAGLVTEVVSMLKDDGEISAEMQQQLKVAALKVGMQAASAVAQRCASGKSFWCCS